MIVIQIKMSFVENLINVFFFFQMLQFFGKKKIVWKKKIIIQKTNHII